MPAHNRRKETTQGHNAEANWFGDRAVTAVEKTGLVQAVFSSVANNYDLMNDLMSGGLHRLWKNQLVGLMRPKAGQTLLDVAGGTGDVALRCYDRTRGQAHITVCDLNPAMLAEGRNKARDRGILDVPTAVGQPMRFIVGNAEKLPIESNSVDTYSIAFGLRNVTHIDRALADAVRVLKPGGRFFCMEFTSGVHPRLKPLYDRYCDVVMPLLGEYVAGDRASYAYLAESIQRFPAQEDLAARMRQAGFEQVTWRNLTGGIAVIHTGWKL